MEAGCKNTAFALLATSQVNAQISTCCSFFWSSFESLPPSLRLAMGWWCRAPWEQCERWRLPGAVASQTMNSKRSKEQRGQTLRPQCHVHQIHCKLGGAGVFGCGSVRYGLPGQFLTGRGISTTLFLCYFLMTSPRSATCSSSSPWGKRGSAPCVGIEVRVGLRTRVRAEYRFTSKMYFSIRNSFYPYIGGLKAGSGLVQDCCPKLSAASPFWFHAADFIQQHKNCLWT